MNWVSVLILLAIAKTYKLKSRSIDFFFAFPQADFDVNVYMMLPIGIYAPDGGNRECVLKLNKSLCGLKQARANWFETLNADLNSIDFEQSQVDQFVFEKI